MVTGLAPNCPLEKPQLGVQRGSRSIYSDRARWNHVTFCAPSFFMGVEGWQGNFPLKDQRVNISGLPATQSVPLLFHSADEAAWKHDCVPRKLHKNRQLVCRLQRDPCSRRACTMRGAAAAFWKYTWPQPTLRLEEREFLHFMLKSWVLEGSSEWVRGQAGSQNLRKLE